MNRKMMKIFAIGVVFLVVFVSATGCCNRNVNKPETQADAGSVHIAVLSVAPWEKYVGDLQPEFDMTPEKALKEVIPTTSIIDEKIIDALGAGLKVALPTASVTSTSTVTSETGKATISQESKTKEKKSGDVSAIKGGDLSLPDRKPSDLAQSSESVDIDPMTKYLAATALYQEVKLLNTYIKNAAMYCDNCTSYVVRLQISLMPSIRDLPYDIYTMLSFFDENQVPDIKRDSTGKIDPSCWPHSKNHKPPYVVPLLVTDNLESILRSSSEDKIREYTIALSALISGVGVGGSFEKTFDKLTSRRGKDLNSLLTVGKVTDNTLRVRLGARQVAGLGEEDRFAMSPRTNNITVLLMVPNTRGDNKKRKISTLAKTIMVHSTEGIPLPPRTGKKLVQLTQEIINRHIEKKTGQPEPEEHEKVLPEISAHSKLELTVPEGEKMVTPDVIPPSKPAQSTVEENESIKAMITYVGENQWDNFLQDCRKLLGKRDMYCNSVWLEIASLYVGAQYSSANFYLPSITPPRLFPVQTVFMLDDTNEKTTVILNNGENLLPSNINATLYLDPSKKKTPRSIGGNEGKCNDIKAHYSLIPDNISISDGGKKSTFSFPSLKALGFNKTWGHLEGDNKLEIRNKEKDKDEYVCLDKVIYVEKPQTAKKDPGFALKVTTASIIANKDGRGTLQVTIKKAKNKPPVKIFFDVEGAEIENITSKPANIFVDDGKGERYVNADGTVTFALNNLRDNSTIVLAFYATEKDSPVKVSVPVEKTK